MSGQPVSARAPGRVVLIGDHTDYTGGLVCAMAIDRWTEVRGRRGGGRLCLASAGEPGAVDVALPIADAAGVVPPWGRYVAGVAAQMGLTIGFEGDVSSTIPIGAGLSSSAALEVAAALAFGFEDTARSLALLCQRAEHAATGLPSGILDQLTSASGVEGHVLVLDCHTLTVEPVRMPDAVAIVVRFVAHRQLVGSPYADRVAECAAAEAVVGPLRLAGLDRLGAIEDQRVRRRACHVVSENQRVRDFAAALATADAPGAGRLMVEGHESLRRDYETSTPAMDAAVEDLLGRRGVYGARMTGGGFGGCVVALTEPGVEIPGTWPVRAVGPAALVNGRATG